METKKEKSFQLPAICFSTLISVALLWLLAAGPMRTWMQERFGTVNLPALAIAVAVFLVLLFFSRLTEPLLKRVLALHGGGYSAQGWLQWLPRIFLPVQYMNPKYLLPDREPFCVAIPYRCSVC